MKWLKDNWLLLIIVIVGCIILFNTCKKEQTDTVVINVDDSINVIIEKKIDSLLKRRYINESKKTIINKNYKYEKKLYNLLPDSLLFYTNVELAKKLLSDSLKKRYIPRRK